MGTENNGYLDADQTIVNFAVRELGISFEQLLSDDPNRMLRNWLKCRRTAKGTAIGTTVLGAIGVMGAVVTGATPLLIAGLAVAGISGLMVKQHSSGATACETEMGILDQCRPILTLLVQLERRGANRSDLVSTYDRLIRAAASNHIDVQDKDRLQAFFQRELEQVAVFSQVAAGMAPSATTPATQLQPEALPAAPDQQYKDEPQDSEADGAIQAAVYLPANALQQPAVALPSPTTDDRFDWAKDLLNFPAVLIWGAQGSGKTSFAAWLLKERLKAGNKVWVCDPHKEYGQWNGLSVIGAGMDYQACDRALAGFANTVKAAYKARSEQPNYKPQRETILVEEFTKWADHCENSAEFFKSALSDLRKIKKGVIFVSHDNSLLALGGAKGVSKARNNGLIQLQLEAAIDPKTGDPTAAMRGKLKHPGKPAIDVAIAPWMKGSMDFTSAQYHAAEPSPVNRIKAQLEDLYHFDPETRPETISHPDETIETPKHDPKLGEIPYTARDSALPKNDVSGFVSGETLPDRVRRVVEMRRNEMTQKQILAVEWGVKAGDSKAYRDALTEYKTIIDRYWKEGDRN